MKRCPECRRDYSDETLSFCLDDGTPLVDGPASIDRSATVIMSDEDATRRQLNSTDSPTAMLPTDSRSGDSGTHEDARSQRSLPSRVLVGLISVAVISAAVFAIYQFKTKKESAGALPAKKITRLTNSGSAAFTTISPDGKYVVYSAVDDSRQTSLWLRHIATSSNVQIVPPAGPGINITQATFSPDSNYIYFIRLERNIPGALYEVPVLGGTPKKILDDVTRISFSPDGSRFAFSRRDQTSGEDAVRIANADGSGEQVLSVRKNPDYYLPGVSWSPDGQTIACPMGGWDGGYYRSIAFIEVSSGEAIDVPPHRWNNLDRVEWLSDGSGLLTTANDKSTDPYQIWMVAFPSGEARTLTNDLNDYRNISLTSDSSALVVTLSDATSNVWVTPLAQPTGGQQITSSKSNGNSGVAWTPDGRVIYVSSDNGNSELWIIGADGRGKRQLTDDGNGKRYPCVTFDGQNILFDSYRSGNVQLWKVGMDGANATAVTTGPGFGASCSPLDRSVIYTTFGGGGFSIWKTSADGGDPTQLINKYTLIPSISPDGKLIATYYVADTTRASKIGIFPIEGGEAIRQFDLPASGGSGTPPVRWMPDGRAVAYIATQGRVSNLWTQSIEGGAPKQMTDFTSGRIFWFDISRDGKQLALSRGTQTSDAVLMRDFR